MTSAEVGQRIREVRQRRGLSLRALAGGRFTKSALSRMENGSRTLTVENVTELAATLGIHPAQLLFGAPLGVFILLREEGEAREVVGAFSGAALADAWADIAEKAENEATVRAVAVHYVVEFVPLDDADSMYLFAQDRLAEPIHAPKEVLA